MTGARPNSRRAPAARRLPESRAPVSRCRGSSGHGGPGRPRRGGSKPVRPVTWRAFASSAASLWPGRRTAAASCPAAPPAPPGRWPAGGDRNADTAAVRRRTGGRAQSDMTPCMPHQHRQPPPGGRLLHGGRGGVLGAPDVHQVRGLPGQKPVKAVGGGQHRKAHAVHFRRKAAFWRGRPRWRRSGAAAAPARPA